MITEKSFILDIVHMMESDEEYKMRIIDTMRDINDEINDRHLTLQKLSSILYSIGK